MIHIARVPISPMVFADVCMGWYDPEDPDINTTPYLLPKIYEYLIGTSNIPPAYRQTEASLYFAKPDQEIEFACQAHDPDTIENGGNLIYMGFR